MVDWIEEYQRNQQKAKEIILSDEYMGWLKAFLGRRYRFDDTDSQYYSDRIDDIDRTNIDLISALFNGVDHYASEADLYPTLCEYGVYYNVKDGDFCFRIGLIQDENSRHFCEKLAYNRNKNYIEYNDLIEYYKFESNGKNKKKNKVKVLRLN